MSSKNNRVFAVDGSGYANNQAECQRKALTWGLRDDQFTVVQEGHDNYDQTAALYVTDAAAKKIKQKRSIQHNM